MSLVGLDLETYLIAPGRLAPPIVCVSTAAVRGDSVDPYTISARADGRMRDVVYAVLGYTPIVAHNAAFDLACIAAQWRDTLPKIWAAYESGLIRCTMIREALIKLALGDLQSDSGFGGKRANLSLASCVAERLRLTVEGKHGPDVWRLRYAELADTPLAQWPEAATAYAGRDAELAAKLYLAQTRDYGGDIADEIPQTQYAWALHLMACHGLRADGARVAALKASLEDRVRTARVALESAGVLRDGSKVMAAIRGRVEAAYADRGVPRTAPSARFPEGQIATASDVLAASGDPVLEQLAQIHEDEGELTKYIPALEAAAQGPINPRITPLVATGRTSVSQPPLQQLPRREGVRECIVPRAGRLFVGADYSTQELVTLAQTCLWRFGHSRLADVLREGLDPHLATAAELLGMSYAEALRERKTERVKSARQLAKALSFGLPGGLGAHRFCDFAWASYGVRLTADEAQDLKRRWLGWYPEMRAHFSWVADRVEAGGGYTTITQLGSERVRGNCKFTDACNTLFQGLAADMSKRALWLIQRENFLASGPLAGSRAVLFMHDEIILESPAATAADAGERLSSLMIQAGREVCPDVPIKAEPWIARRWSKNAETVRDENGRLLVWEGA